MISVIVSKYHPSDIEILKANIAESIGVPYELLITENGRGEMGLCEVYNRSASLAQFDILCYTHEDVDFQTPAWGKKVLQIFAENKRLGLLGVAGSAFKSCSPSGWWYPNASNDIFRSNYIQSNKARTRLSPILDKPLSGNLSPVVCVDGFWFCTPRQVALDLRFDDRTFRGFHCYDIDYSLTVFCHYEVAVTFDIMIKHFSEGCFNGEREWIEESLLLYNKWKHMLPKYALNIDREKILTEEIKCLDYFLQAMLQNGYTAKEVFSLLSSVRLHSILGRKENAMQFLKLIKKILLTKSAPVKNPLLLKKQSVF